MQTITALTGPTCSGKTTSLLNKIRTEKEQLNTSNTLVVVLDSEKNLFSSIIPAATFKNINDVNNVQFETIIIDHPDLHLLEKKGFDFSGADSIYITSQEVFKTLPIDRGI